VGCGRAARKRAPQLLRNHGGMGTGANLACPAPRRQASRSAQTSLTKSNSDPAWKNDPAMVEHFAFMKRYYPDGNPAEPFNVNGRIAAGAMIQVLTQCGDNLTREKVMRQAESLRNFAHPLLLPGIKVNTGSAATIRSSRCSFSASTGRGGCGSATC